VSLIRAKSANIVNHRVNRHTLICLAEDSLMNPARRRLPRRQRLPLIEHNLLKERKSRVSRRYLVLDYRILGKCD
jgi:hypothetical protein